ncbi:CENP-B homolog protein 2-like [Rhizophagus clarus]|uniref:CENP-B homolog protein 2-like n=1 Tax=Rhizophagus clarus TaxID=94130 RepID=A0A8H3LFA4_9GLOM|nr:CENP-B homolog protein 2-like [Rhizophagus clarus]
MPPNQQRRSAINDDLKRQICEWSEANKNKKHYEVAQFFNEKYPNVKIDQSTVSKILKEKDKWKAVVSAEVSNKTFRHREAKFPSLDHAMSLWVENATAGGVTLTDLLIKEKARVFAQAFNIQESELVFLNEWLEKFKKRNNIQRYRAHREAGSAPLESLAEEQMKLRRLLGQFTLDQIYNIDKTGLFYRMPPNQTLSTKPILGQKKDKTRITVLLANPNPDSHNIDDDGSTGAGSRSQHRSRGRRDNNASGREVTQLNLTHVEVAFLPPNTTSHLQPLDAGVIKGFKAHYKRNYCQHILKLFEEGKDINKEKVNIKEAVDYLADAWENVSGDMIFNCWVKTGILPSTTDNDIADATQVQQAILNKDVADINQIIEDLGAESDDPLADSLANALNDFCDLDEEIPTEDVLNENDIIKLIQEEMNEENDNSDDSENEPVLVSLDDATKSLQTWVTFFEQQEIDEFKNEDGHIFKKYLKTVHKLKMQTKKQAQITSFFRKFASSMIVDLVVTSNIRFDDCKNKESGIILVKEREVKSIRVKRRWTQSGDERKEGLCKLSKKFGFRDQREEVFQNKENDKTTIIVNKECWCVKFAVCEIVVDFGDYE